MEIRASPLLQGRGEGVGCRSAELVVAKMFATRKAYADAWSESTRKYVARGGALRAARVRTARS